MSQLYSTAEVRAPKSHPAFSNVIPPIERQKIAAEALADQINHFCDTNSFFGSLTENPNFRVKILPDGKEAALASRAKLGATIRRNLTTLAMADINSKKMAFTVINPAIRQVFGIDPAWRARDIEKTELFTRIEGPGGLVMALECIDGPVQLALGSDSPLMASLTIAASIEH